MFNAPHAAHPAPAVGGPGDDFEQDDDTSPELLTDCPADCGECQQCWNAEDARLAATARDWAPVALACRAHGVGQRLVGPFVAGRVGVMGVCHA